jgi:hypothetical protein
MLREMDERPDRCGTIVAGHEGPGWQALRTLPEGPCPKGAGGLSPGLNVAKLRTIYLPLEVS